MKTKSRAFLPLVLGISLAFSNRWAVDQPAYQPQAGASVSKRVSILNELELDDMSLEMDGQDLSEIAGQIEMSMKISTEIGVTDLYEAVAGGRPTKLKRSFDEISSSTHVSGSNPQLGNQEKDIPLKSELEGSTVVFTWDANDSTYTTAFDGDKGDEELLENLEENLDLSGFLPSGEVSNGDSWEIPAEAVKAALAPGGDVKLRPEGQTDPTSGMDRFSQSDLVGDLTGKFTAVYQGTREEGDTKVAVIKLKIEAKSAQDMHDRLDEIQEQMKGSMPPGLEVELSAFDIEYEYEAEGELLWNLEAGLFKDMNLSGEVRMILDMSMDMKMGEREQSMEMSQNFAGTQTITYSTGE